MDGPQVVSVSAGGAHGPCKPVRASIELVAGLGVAGDAHLGRTVQHRSRARAHPDWENRRQVHLLAAELHHELAQRGLLVGAGEMGENVLTRDLDLLALPTGARLRVGPEAVIEITGLRNPCSQLGDVRPGLMQAVLDRAPDGTLIRRAGVMSIVRTGGIVKTGDSILIDALPIEKHILRPV